nr:10687_t:CDS:2 [Entrophospora candida]
MQLNNNNGEDNSNENNSVNRIMDDFMTMLMDTTTQNRELVRDISNMNNRLLTGLESANNVKISQTNTPWKSSQSETLCYRCRYYVRIAQMKKVAPPFKDNFNPPHILKQQQQ